MALQRLAVGDPYQIAAELPRLPLDVVGQQRRLEYGNHRYSMPPAAAFSFWSFLNS